MLDHALSGLFGRRPPQSGPINQKREPPGSSEALVIAELLEDWYPLLHLLDQLLLGALPLDEEMELQLNEPSCGLEPTVPEQNRTLQSHADGHIRHLELPLFQERLAGQHEQPGPARVPLRQQIGRPMEEGPGRRLGAPPRTAVALRGSRRLARGRPTDPAVPGLRRLARGDSPGSPRIRGRAPRQCAPPRTRTSRGALPCAA